MKKNKFLNKIRKETPLSIKKSVISVINACNDKQPKLTKDILEEIKSTTAEYYFDPADFSSDIDSEFYKGEEEMFFEIGDRSYCIDINIMHTWTKSHNGNDGFNNPSEYESENEETYIEIEKMFINGDEMNFKELKNELTSHIYEKYIYNILE